MNKDIHRTIMGSNYCLLVQKLKLENQLPRFEITCSSQFLKKFFNLLRKQTEKRRRKTQEK